MRSKKLSNKILSLLVVISSGSGCGVKGKPLPPEPPVIMKKDKWTDSEKAKKEKKDNEDDPAKKNQ